MDGTEVSGAAEIDPGLIADAMNQALEFARVHEGATAPNPPVGCVLLDRSGAVLAGGAHTQSGAPHAEAAAIAAAREAGVLDRVHVVVVTLEPCNHHGRTPPCVEAILQTPARQVWIACPDPNPHVAGGGAGRLVRAGRAVHFMADLADPRAAGLAADARRLIAPFAKRATGGLPFITVKQALTAEGDMTPPPGRTTFTSQSSLVLAHRLRRRADAILTGSGTVLADNPAFSVRLTPDHPGKQRQLVILDRRRRTPAAYLDAARARGLNPLIADDLAQALSAIVSAGALEVLVEAGPLVTTAVLDSGLWDEHVLIQQTAGGGEDRVTIRRRDDASLSRKE